MKRKIKSIDGKMVVRVLREERTTASGLYIGDDSSDRSIKCEAVSVGGIYTPPAYPKQKKVPPPCKEGDIVYIQRPSRKPDFRMDGSGFYSIPFVEVLVVIRDVVLC